jgi:AraC-like DNA-binding protein
MYATHRQHLPTDAVATTVTNATRAYATGWHAHDEFMFLLPRHAGLLFETEAGRRGQRLQPSCVALVAPTVHHATSATQPDQRHLAVYADPDYVRHCTAQLGLPPSRLGATGVWQLSPTAMALLRLREELPAAVDGLRRLQAADADRLLATECIAIALTGTGLAPSPINAVRAYIDEHLDERLSLDQLAAEFLMSRRHLTRVFRDAMGCSVTEYVTRRRIEQARGLLADPRTTVLQAALAVGIESPSYFAKLYRRIHGHAPSERR